MVMTDKMKFVVTSNREVANKLKNEGHVMLNSNNGKYTFVYNEALPQTFEQSLDCYFTNTLTF